VPAPSRPRWGVWSGYALVGGSIAVWAAAATKPDLHSPICEEDRLLDTLGMWLFLLAFVGALRLFTLRRDRVGRWLAAGVAVLCLGLIGDELDWGKGLVHVQAENGLWVHAAPLLAISESSGGDVYSLHAYLPGEQVAALTALLVGGVYLPIRGVRRRRLRRWIAPLVPDRQLVPAATWSGVLIACTLLSDGSCVEEFGETMFAAVVAVWMWFAAVSIGPPAEASGA